MELTDGQKKGLEIACQRYKDNKPYTVIAGYAGTGKAQPVDTLIPTPNGYRKLGEIKIGDRVFDRHGQPTEVLGAYPQGMLDCYKVELSDGRVTYCNDEHLWSYYTSKNNLYAKSLKDMINSGLYKPDKRGGRATCKYQIPTSDAVNFRKKDFDVDPYVVGVFLGDGCCRENLLSLSSADEFVVKKVANLLNATGYYRQHPSNYIWRFTCNKHSGINGRTVERLHTQEVFNKLPELLNYSGDKRIPRQYLFCSKEQRLSLIQGLMDTDGCIQESEGRYNISYTSTSVNLINDMRQVLFSLGYSSSVSKDNRTKYKTKEFYTLYINIANEEKYKLFTLPRRRDVALDAIDKQKRKKYDRISIKKVTKCNYQKEMVCIYVDNPEHLYLTNDYIVTHNTTLVQYIIKELKLKDNEVVFACFTGKAALVLKEKGNKNTMTAHKLLYHSEEQADGTYIHTPKHKLDHKYKLIVVDEASMLPQEMIDLLLSHHVYTIFLGDPAQLPPISGEQTILTNPHVFLDEIVRQALDNPIIKLSMDIRHGMKLHYTAEDKRCRVLPRSKVSDKMLLGADQILCGKNKTRNELNYYMRKLILGDNYSDEPVEGDKVICLKNSWNKINNVGNELVNGTIGTLKNVYITDKHPYEKVVLADFVSDDGGIYKDLMIDYNLIVNGEPTVNSENWQRFSGYPKPLEFTFGYVITCHKAQGSQYDRVVVFDEAFGKYDEQMCWKYTACTRAVKQLVMIE